MKVIYNVCCIIVLANLTACQLNASTHKLFQQSENRQVAQDLFAYVQGRAPTDIKTKTHGDCDQSLTTYQLTNTESISILQMACGDYGAQFHAFYLNEQRVVQYHRKQHIVNLQQNANAVHIHREDLMHHQQEHTHKLREQIVPVAKAYTYPFTITTEFTAQDTQEVCAEQMAKIYKQLVVEF